MSSPYLPVIFNNRTRYLTFYIVPEIQNNLILGMDFWSRSLNPQERNYSATEREALAVIVAIKHWRCYLDNGQKFLVYTDQSALKWFINLNNPTGRLARWGIRLSALTLKLGTDAEETMLFLTLYPVQFSLLPSTTANYLR